MFVQQTYISIHIYTHTLYVYIWGYGLWFEVRVWYLISIGWTWARSWPFACMPEWCSEAAYAALAEPGLAELVVVN